MTKACFPYHASRWLIATLILTAVPRVLAVDWDRSLVKIRVTKQSYDLMQPWQKLPREGVNGFGVVISGDRILTQANLLANATFVELGRVGSDTEAKASVLCVDYISNLAILTTDEADFLDDLKPVRILKHAHEGDKLTACQFEGNDSVTLSTGNVKDVDTQTYPTSIGSFLVYQVSIELALGNTGIVPFFKGSKLAGLMMGYNAANRTANLIPAPMIQHFLADLEDNGTYDGFPRAGFSYSTIVDPQLRRYVGLADGQEGIYITHVQPGGPADLAGLQTEDVLLGINGYPIDKHAEYKDPEYGRISITHLLSTRSYAGDELDLHLLRQGQEVSVRIRLEARSTEEYPIEPFIVDREPKFIVVAGFLFQELSGELLRAWGNDWQNKAPRRLTRLQRHQWEQLGQGRKLVILTQVIPAPGNVGYEQLRFVDVDTINGVTITRLEDIPEALKAPVDGFHRVVFGDATMPDVIIDAATVLRENAFIQNRYRLPLLSRF